MTMSHQVVEEIRRHRVHPTEREQPRHRRTKQVRSCDAGAQPSRRRHESVTDPER
jgi:hypothetical protein